jgi:2,4-dienoyl-CoA reductase-like NADH-dependent reductase (Old Yellow Enzyme family)
MQLLKRVERYLQRSGMTATRFGRDSIRDPSFVHQLRQGREPRRGTEERIDAYLACAEAALGDTTCAR